MSYLFSMNMMYFIVCLAFVITKTIAVDSTTLCISNNDARICTAGCSRIYDVSVSKEILVNTSNTLVLFCSSTIVFNEATVRLVI